MLLNLPSASEIRRYRQFAGEKVVRLLILGTAVGLILFGIEIAFAYVLQSFFVAIGVASAEMLRIPKWVPQGSVGIVVAALLTVGVLRGLLYWAQQYLPNATMEESACYQRERILHWTFQSKTVSSAQTMNLFNELNNATAFALMAAQALTVSVTGAIFLGSTLFYLSPQLTVVVGALMLILAFPLQRMGRKVDESNHATWAEWAKTYSVLLGSIKNLLLMQIYGTQDIEEAKATGSLRNYRDHKLTHWRNAGLKYALPQVFGVFAICLIAVTTSRREGFPAGLLISYFYILIRFVQAIAGCAQNSSGITTYLVPMKQLYRWWSQDAIGQYSPRGISPAVQARQEQARNQVTIESPIGWNLRDVGFQYPGAAAPVLARLNLAVEPGKAVVILGPSGAGKSTLLNLVLGQIDPTAGTIEVSLNGKARPLKEVLGSVLSGIGYVGPESFLIEGSVRVNLMYGLPFTPSADEIAQALELAGCQFVNAMPLGLEHPISEQGTGLSAGQKQRLSLARALLRKPRALILDEATSNLDSDTELKLVRTLGELKGRMTLVAVTHRQPLLEIADQRFDL